MATYMEISVCLPAAFYKFSKGKVHLYLDEDRRGILVIHNLYVFHDFNFNSSRETYDKSKMLPMMTDLIKFWPHLNVKGTFAGPDIWLKHGPPTIVMEQEPYFKTALRLYNKLGFEHILRVIAEENESNLVTSKSDSKFKGLQIQVFYDAVCDYLGHGALPILECFCSPCPTDEECFLFHITVRVGMQDQFMVTPRPSFVHADVSKIIFFYYVP